MVSEPLHLFLITIHIDYSINMDTAKLTLTNFTLNKDDILQFIVFKQSSE